MTPRKRKETPDELILIALASIDKPEYQYHGLTEVELVERTGLTPKQVKSRVSAMNRQDMVRDTFSKRSVGKVRSATVWAISPKALPLFISRRKS